MKFRMFIGFLFFACCLLPGISLAQNKVVVIPLGGDCPPGLTVCNGTCVDTNNNPSFCGDCDTECGVGRFCSNGVCVLKRLGAPCTAHSDCLAGGCVDDICADVKLVFVTSLIYEPSFGSLTTADDVCQARAVAGGLPGTYLAWLSDSTGSPSTRFTLAVVPYVRPDGVVVADSWTDLTDGIIYEPINVSEDGTPVPANEIIGVWTGTTEEGGHAGTLYDCNGWTSRHLTHRGAIGDIGSSIGGWTLRRIDNPCGYDIGGLMMMRLYCFQQ